VTERKERQDKREQMLLALDQQDDSYRSGAVCYENLTELENLRTKAEELRTQLQALSDRRKLDPEVLAIERNLDDVLSRYYWLWLKLKDHTNGDVQ